MTNNTINRMADTINQRWAIETGSTIREIGTREGDNDREEMANEIIETLEIKDTLAMDMISDALKEWHRKLNTDPLAEAIENLKLAMIERADELGYEQESIYTMTETVDTEISELSNALETTAEQSK